MKLGGNATGTEKKVSFFLFSGEGEKRNLFHHLAFALFTKPFGEMLKSLVPTLQGGEGEGEGVYGCLHRGSRGLSATQFVHHNNQIKYANSG